ncbi:MAG: putative transposase [Candidatus Omnitrophota bacterium]|jgi:putative transposase
MNVPRNDWATLMALKLAVAEIYVQGVSARKVSKITEELCGLELSPTQVSRIAKGLDENLRLFRNRPLEGYPFAILDAKYIKIRHAGTVRSLACLVAVGINPEGSREVIGILISLSQMPTQD